GLAQCPVVPAGPITQPVVSESQVTELGCKLGGRYPPTAGAGFVVAVLRGVAAPLDAGRVGSTLGCLVADPSVDFVAAVPLGAAPFARLALVGVGFRRSDMLTGTATPTAAATAAAEATEITALRILRRRARLVISSKVPAGGGSGRTCWFSQRSSGSCSLSA